VHCNPGGTYLALGWQPDEIEKATEDHEAACSLTASVIDGRHVGSIRVSFGYANVREEVATLLAFFDRCFVERPRAPTSPTPGYNLAQIIVHPIRGCRGVAVCKDPYPMTKGGLMFDEGWGIADELSRFLDRRRWPALMTLGIAIDDAVTTMTVTAPDGRSISISLVDSPNGTKMQSSTACREKIAGEVYGQEVNSWFSSVLGQKLSLVRIEVKHMRPFRCVFRASLEAIGSPDIEQLRPHLVFDSRVQFSEDALEASLRKLGPDLVYAAERLEITTEALIDGEGNESIEPLRSICALHPMPGGRIVFGLSLAPDFLWSSNTKLQLSLGATLK
jgi:uncharacterized protein YcbX